MPVNKTITLTDEERADVRHAMTEAKLPSDPKDSTFETEDAYLARIDRDGSEVTDSTLRSFREARYKANRDALAQAADELLKAGLDAGQMVGRALRFAVASSEVQAKVDELLAPFAEAAAAAQVAISG
jgi:hypothetical protein